jgi:acyl carrier protein
LKRGSDVIERGDGVQIQREVRDFIKINLGRDLRDVTDTDSLLEAGIVDSMGVLALVGFIEQRYGIAVGDEEMMPENFDSISSIAGFVAKRQHHDA